MKKKKIILTLLIFISAKIFPQDWGQFNQKIDVTNYKGGQFKLTAFVKVDNANPKITVARLWARVDKEKGMAFLENMYKRPILSNTWGEYSIEGPIDEKAVKLFVGGIFTGIGKYYFDNFSLMIKPKEGDWQSYPLSNSGFENASYDNWKFEKNNYTTSLSPDAYEGKQSLMIDGSTKITGKFVNANNIDFYYETYGQGDTVLLLHGNSESLKSFKKQIPDFSKQFFVVAMDSRAQGYSSDDGSKITYELMAEDVNSFLEKLQMKNVNVLGWSDGGNIGLILAMKHPDKLKKLAITGANLFNDETSVDSKINKQFKSLKENFIKEQIPPNDIRMRMVDLILNEPKIDPDDLKSITCQTLVMAGSKDVIKENHTKLIASKIKNSKLHIFEKSTHYAPQEIPERFNKVVIDFFKQK